MEALFDGRWETVTPSKSRQVLALLLCAPSQVVLVDQIVTDLWQERLPQTPSGLVRNYIMKLRRFLNDNAQIVTRSGGYQLDIDPVIVDAVCFERCVREARKCRDAHEAEKLLEQALSYWWGPALADVRQCMALDQEAGRLERLRVTAQLLRAELMLARASFAEAVGELQPLMAIHPGRERLWEAAVVALACDGRPAEALEAFARFRDYHRAEFGLDPSDRMTALQRAVLRGQVSSWELSTRRQLNEE